MVTDYWKDNMPTSEKENVALAEVRLLVIHDGVFHADDVLTYALAHKVFEKTVQSEAPNARFHLARSSKSELDPMFFSKSQILVADIGGGEFDHHQRDRQTHEVDGCVVPYSACSLYMKALHENGLDVKVFGEEKAKELMALVTEVERGDNGQPKWKFEDNLSKVISSLNPTSLEQLSVTEGKSYEEGQKSLKELYDKKFQEAVELVDNLIIDRDIELTHGDHNSLLSGIVHGDEKALAYVTRVQIEREQALKQCEEEMLPRIETAYQNSNRCGVVLTPEPNGAIWGKVLTQENHKDALFVVYPSIRGGFNLQCVPPSYGSFEQRCSLDPEVCKKYEATFVHQGKFLAAFETLEDAVRAGTEHATRAIVKEEYDRLVSLREMETITEETFVDQMCDIRQYASTMDSCSLELFKQAEMNGWKIDKRKWHSGDDDQSGTAAGDRDLDEREI